MLELAPVGMSTTTHLVLTTALLLLCLVGLWSPVVLVSSPSIPVALSCDSLEAPLPPRLLCLLFSMSSHHSLS